MGDELDRAADLLATRQHVVALTGAGISVESGTPNFRSAEGLWERYDPEEYGTTAVFLEGPAGRILHELAEVVQERL
jgi:NAD-dependent deacetylase